MRERSSEFYTSKWEYCILAGAVIFSLVFLFNNDAPQIEYARGLFLDTYALLQQNFSWINERTPSQGNIKKLRRHATRLMLENSQLREAYLENHRLRKMLDYQQRTEIKFKSARVLFKEIGVTPNAVVIDAGTSAGMRMNMPVITHDGLVGKLLRVNRNTSHVQLMLDHNFSVSARIQRSRVLGVVSWGHVSGLEIAGVSRNADVKIGDVVVTSAYSSLFHAGIRVGLVENIVMDPASLFLSIFVTPEAHFSRLEEVFVITSPLN